MVSPSNSGCGFVVSMRSNEPSRMTFQIVGDPRPGDVPGELS
jgi:hypothetical protein